MPNKVLKSQTFGSKIGTFAKPSIIFFSIWQLSRFSILFCQRPSIIMSEYQAASRHNSDCRSSGCMTRWNVEVIESKYIRVHAWHLVWRRASLFTPTLLALCGSVVRAHNSHSVAGGQNSINLVPNCFHMPTDNDCATVYCPLVLKWQCMGLDSAWWVL